MAINKAFSEGLLRGSRVLARTRVLLEEEFGTDLPELIARTQLGLAAMIKATQIFRDAIRRLTNISQKCDSPCCSSAAKALGVVYVAETSNISTAVLSRGVPLVVDPATGFLNLQQVLEFLVGTPMTPDNKPITTNGSFQITVNTILRTVTLGCPCPPDDKDHDHDTSKSEDSLSDSDQDSSCKRKKSHRKPPVTDSSSSEDEPCKKKKHRRHNNGHRKPKTHPSTLNHRSVISLPIPSQ